MDIRPLQLPAYRRLFGGVVVTMLGQQMTLVAVPYQVYALTGSSLLVGVTSVVALVPLVVFALLFGLAANGIEPGPRAALVQVFTGVAQTMLRIVGWVLWVAPPEDGGRM